MKQFLRKLPVFMLALLVVFLLPVMADDASAADNSCGNSITWTLDNGVLTLSGSGEMYDFQQGQAPWYGQKDSITAIKADPAITHIGSYAFYELYELTTAEMSGIVSIGDYAFERTNLTSFNAPALKTVGDSAFRNCYNLTYVNLSAAESIGKEAFFYCPDLSGIDLRNISHFGTEAFWCCTGLGGELVLSKATEMENGVFGNCSGITAASLPKMTEIPNGTFADCNQLQTVSAPLAQSIGNEAFRSNAALQSVSFSAAQTVGYSAFAGCTALSDVQLPNVTSIGSHAFEKCHELTSVTLPALTDLGNDIFRYCSKISHVSFPVLTEIKDFAFRDNSTIVSVDAPKVTSVGERAFESCDKLQSVNMPALESVKNLAFQGCAALRSVSFPKLASVSYGCFLGCSALETADLPAATEIGQAAFASCTALYSAQMPAAKSIGQNCFERCSSLETISITTDLETVAPNAFNGCSALHTIYLGKSKENWEPLQVSEEGNGPFLRAEIVSDAPALTIEPLPAALTVAPNANAEITVSANGSGLTYRWQRKAPGGNEWNDLPNGTGAKLVYGPVSAADHGSLLRCIVTDYTGSSLTSTEVTLQIVEGSVDNPQKCGDNITWTLVDGTLTLTGSGRMYDYADSNTLAPWTAERETIHTIIVSPKITYIGTYAFYFIPYVHSATLPDVTTIGEKAFSSCGVNVISAPNAKTVRANAFLGCDRLTTVDMPQLTSVQEAGFRGCTALQSISLPKLTSLGTNAFAECFALYAVDFPKLTEISDGAFRQCRSMVTFDASQYTSIPGQAFEGCTALQSIKLDNATHINWAAFEGCTALTSVYAPKATTAANRAFAGCTALQEAIMPALTKTNPEVFADCTALRSFNASNLEEIGDGLLKNTAVETINFPLATSIGSYAFAGCYSLKEAALPSAPHIPIAAFLNCNALTTLTISTDLKGIGESAFSGCSALKTVYVYVTTDDWNLSYYPGNDAFINAEMLPGGNSVILGQLPETITARKDQVLTLTAPVTGTPLAYQWSILPPNATEWIPLTTEDNPTANSATFVYGPVTMEDSGMQLCVTVVDGTGIVRTSNPTTLTVTPFDDVDGSAFYYEPLLWALDKGITTGTSATTFSPDNPCTRAQVVTFLWRAKGCPAPASSETKFTDVPADAYYRDAVLWAVEQGITTGTSETTFSPDAPCTRAQIVTLLWRAAGKPAGESGTASFVDVPADSYYADAVLWAAEQRITTGTSANTFSPDAPCTRAQIVTFLFRS